MTKGDTEIKEKYLIREAGPEDAERIHQVEETCFPIPWSLQSISKDLTCNPMALYLVIEKTDLPGRGTEKTQDTEGVRDKDPAPDDAARPRPLAGYIGMWIIGDEIHINNVSVMPEERGRGLGGMLIEEMLQRMPALGASVCTLEVRANNEPAIRLYEKYGFMKEGIRPGYYEDDGTDAIIMWRR